MRKAAGILSLILFAAGVTWAQTLPPSLAETARKAREERAKMGAAKVPMYTNDNIPRAGSLSIAGPAAAPVTRAGTEAAATEGEAAAAGEGEAAAKKEEKCDEQCWKGKFRDQRGKIKDAEKELDVMQREYNLARVQYNQDPNVAMRDQYSNNTAGGRELQDLQNRINNKKADIDKLKQALSALEDDLRKSGGEPGWARE